MCGPRRRREPMIERGCNSPWPDAGGEDAGVFAWRGFLALGASSLSRQ